MLSNMLVSIEPLYIISLTPREGGQGDRSHIRDKPQTPRGRVGGKRDAQGVAGGCGKIKKRGLPPPLFVFYQVNKRPMDSSTIRIMSNSAFNSTNTGIETLIMTNPSHTFIILSNNPIHRRPPFVLSTAQFSNP